MAERQFSPDELPSVPLPPPLRRRAPQQPKPPRSIESRVFWAVLCALLVFSGLSTIGYAIRLLVARAAVAQVQQEMMQQFRQVEQQSARETQAARVHQALDQEYHEREAAVERARYVLADDQRCVGGAVIQVDGNSYPQIGSIAQPVHCVGNLADRPLR